MDDLAAAAVEKATGTRNEIIDAIGPETFTYREMVVTIGAILGCKRPIISVRPGLGYWACQVVGRMVGDVVITREEIKGLMEGRSWVDAPPLGKTKLTDWVRERPAHPGTAVHQRNGAAGGSGGGIPVELTW